VDDDLASRRLDPVEHLLEADVDVAEVVGDDPL
jgi:hypothetical protein